MCGKGGGSPPVPSAASTTFNSTVSPAPTVAPLYQDFLNRAQTLSNTPFNPAMTGSVAPLTAEQTQAGGQLFAQGMDMGNFDPAKVQSIMSPYTEQVVNATQNWFNNQNAIQGNDLISQAIRTGNAFGGDRAGVAEGVLAGQQQLAQAPVIAGLRERGYTQALDEYNRLKQFGMAGAQAALGWGSLEQQQAQREKDVAQQNAMMESAYPFQTMNWYGSALGGIGPLMGQTAAGSNNPPSPNATGQIIGAASAGAGLLGAIGNVGGGAPSGGGASPVARGGFIHRARGGIVDDDSGDFGGRDNVIYLPVHPRRFAFGGDPSSDDSEEDLRDRSDALASSKSEQQPQPDYSSQNTQGARKIVRPDFGFGQLKLGARQLPQPVFPSTGSTQPQQKSDAEQWLNFGTKAVKAVAPFFIERGGSVRRYADGGGDDTEIMSDVSPDPILPGQQFARDYAGRTTWFNPRNESGGYTYRDESGQNWTDTGARALREGPHASGLPSTVRGFATPGSSDLGNWFEVNLPGGRKTYAQKTDIGPPGVVDLNAPLASSVGYNPGNVGGRTYVRDLGRDRPPGAGGTQWPDPSQGNTNVSGLPSGQQPSTPAWQVPRPPSVAGGPSPDADVQGGPGRGQGDLRPGESRTIPGMAKPPQTFAQRWASNPFTQFGASMLSQRGPYLGVNVGNAMLGTMSAQEAQRKQDLLDAKPQMIEHNGRILFRIGDRVTDMGLATSTAETREAAKAARPYAVETEAPGRFGTTTKKKEYYTDEPGGGRKPFESPVQPEQTGQQPRVIPEEQPPAQQLPPPQQPPPRQPAPQQQPQQPPPRQTQAPPTQGGGTGTIAGDLQRPLEERLAAAESAAAGTTGPPPTATPAPTQQAQQTQPQAQPQLAGGPSKSYSHEDAWKSIIPAGTVTNPGALEATRNPAALEGLSPDDQRTIKAVADYRVDPNKLFPGVKNSEIRAGIDGYAREYDSNYDPRNLPARSQALKEYGVSGQSAQSLKSNNMVLEHIGDAMTAVDNLGNSTVPIYNKITGTWQRETGNEKYQAAKTAVLTTVNAAATESAKTFRGVGSMSQREQELWNKVLLGTGEGEIPSASPVEMRAALKELTGLVAGRLNSTANGYNQIMGPEYYRDGASWMTPKAKETFGRAASITPEQNTPFPPSQYKATPSSGGPQQQQGTSGGGTQEGAKRSFKEGPATFTGGKWVLD